MARPRTHTAEMREHLTRCAMETVAEAGFSAVATRELADQAGTSTAAVYALFGSKELLQRAVLLKSFAELAADQGLVTPTDDPVADIAGLGARYVQWAIDHPRLYEAMFGDAVAGLEPSDELVEARRRAFIRVSDAVRRALDSGAFRSADEETVVASLWAQVHGLAALLIADQLPPAANPAEAAWATIQGWLADGTTGKDET